MAINRTLARREFGLENPVGGIVYISRDITEHADALRVPMGWALQDERRPKLRAIAS